MNVKVKVIEKLKLKNEEAFNEVYFSYHRLIYYIIYTMVKNEVEAEDLTQEAFIKMYNNIHKLNNDSKFHYWFIKLTKNITLNYMKKDQKIIEFNEEFMSEVLDYSYRTYPPNFEFNEFLDNLENFIITLKFVYGLSFHQICQETGKSMSVVTKAYYRAVKKLQNHYGRR